MAAGRQGVEEALGYLARQPLEELTSATLDHHRALRCGRPEVIFCQGKTVEQVVEIAGRLAAHGDTVLATRASAEQLAALGGQFEKAIEISQSARAAVINPPAAGEAKGPPVTVMCAGTSDIPVLDEAVITLRSSRVPTRRIVDVGVSGLHRLLGHLPVLQESCAVVVVAGMEGALPSVVGGLVACPVFAVPTSIGYGASLGGIAALLSMLNSCASSVVTVNIDNGFGAGYAATLVYQQVMRHAAVEKS